MASTAYGVDCLIRPVPRHEPTIPQRPPYVMGEPVVDYCKGGLKITCQTPKMEPIEDEL